MYIVYMLVVVKNVVLVDGDGFELLLCMVGE